jgi:Flp pilus assembly protein TadG
VLRDVSARVRRFLAARKGNVAVLYALILVPITLASSGAIDYARAVMVRTAMTSALDSAALAVAQSKGLTDAQMQTLAQQYFDANYHQAADCAHPTVAITKTGQNILVSTNCAMPTTILQLIGMSSLSVNSSSTVTYGQTKLWVSLVLDNTGSMSDTDKTGLSKMTALKNASYSLLTMLQNAGTSPGDVQVAIIPFTNDVNIGKSNTTWIDWTYWDNKVGSCNISGKTDATSCKVNGTWSVNRWGSGSCNIPGYNTQTSCEKAVGTWTISAHSNWNGCVTDRGNMSGPDATHNYDVMNSAPVTGQASSLFPTDLPSGCPQTLMGLNYNWTNLNSKIKAMTANGSTNQAIGLAWGWHALTQGAPLSPPALPDQTQRVIIILSDGFNTKDRWWGDGIAHSSEADARMAMVCANAKADGIVIYAVFVDINGAQGNSTVLQNCATDISKYYDLTSASDIQTAFNDIGQQITNLRVSR